ncbi:LysR family transcriptional regulator [Novosphingobium flavum]|uniref:LysR family transcriptional regulator n=1 Tax=Novosphingobium flavum TaxID=1778672 RepID=A0A7X1FR34_9SPHN|nr:LysR family transcriptional regulator [Novosphingobium flavum]
MSVRQLVLFDAVARHGTLKRAAAEFGLSQPAATQSIAALQERSGLDLIERRGRQNVLTAVGEALRQRLPATLARLEQGLAELGAENPRRACWHITRAQLTLMADLRRLGTLEHVVAAMGAERRAALRAVRTLEAQVGSRLLESAGGQTELTGAGIILADRLGNMPDEIDMIVRDLSSLADGSRPALVVGVMPDPGTAGLDAVVLGHLEAGFDAQLVIVEGHLDDLVGRLILGKVDLIVGHVPDQDRKELTWRVLERSSFVVVARKQHPMAGRRGVPLHDLVGQTWLLGSAGSDRRKASDILFAGRAQPRCRLVTAAAPLMTRVLAGNDDLAMMTERELAARSQSLCAIAHDAPRVVVTIGWACRHDWVPTPAQADFISRLESAFGGA